MLKAFLVFPQHPIWVYYASKPVENAIYCLSYPKFGNETLA